MSETRLCKPWIIFAYTAFQLGPPTLRPAMMDALYFAVLKISLVLVFCCMLKLMQSELELLSYRPMLFNAVATKHVSI